MWKFDLTRQKKMPAYIYLTKNKKRNDASLIVNGWNGTGTLMRFMYLTVTCYNREEFPKEACVIIKG